MEAVFAGRQAINASKNLALVVSLLGPLRSGGISACLFFLVRLFEITEFLELKASYYPDVMFYHLRGLSVKLSSKVSATLFFRASSSKMVPAPYIDNLCLESSCILVFGPVCSETFSYMEFISTLFTLLPF